MASSAYFPTPTDLLAQAFSDSDARHRSIQAIHGDQALELLEKERPDLVLSDVMMPVVTGAELCRRFKASIDWRGIPVILMSAAGQRSAHGTGVDAFITKPFDLDDIEARVQSWLERRAQCQASGTRIPPTPRLQENRRRCGSGLQDDLAPYRAVGLIRKSLLRF